MGLIQRMRLRCIASLLLKAILAIAVFTLSGVQALRAETQNRDMHFDDNETALNDVVGSGKSSSEANSSGESLILTSTKYFNSKKALEGWRLKSRGHSTPMANLQHLFNGENRRAIPFSFQSRLYPF